LKDEMLKRGFKPTKDFKPEIFKEHNLFKDWTPTAEAI